MVTGAPKDLCRLALAGGAFLVLACGHTEPFSTPPYGTNQPFDPTPPVRLTLNTGAGRGRRPGCRMAPASCTRPSSSSRPDCDVCLAELPPTRRHAAATGLRSGRAGDDTTNAIESPAPAADGRLAFLKASGLVGSPNPSGEALAVAPTLDAANAVEVQRIPYTLPGEPSHITASRAPLAGREPAGLPGRGASIYRTPCELCPVDTIRHRPRRGPARPVAPGQLAGRAPGYGLRLGRLRRSHQRRGLLHLERRHPRVPARALDGRPEHRARLRRRGHRARRARAGGRLTAVVGGRVHVVPDAEPRPDAVGQRRHRPRRRPGVRQRRRPG